MNLYEYCIKFLYCINPYEYNTSIPIAVYTSIAVLYVYVPVRIYLYWVLVPGDRRAGGYWVLVHSACSLYKHLSTYTTSSIQEQVPYKYSTTTCTVRLQVYHSKVCCTYSYRKYTIQVPVRIGSMYWVQVVYSIKLQGCFYSEDSIKKQGFIHFYISSLHT